MFQIEALNLEHQNQLTKIQADIEAQIQKQAKINEQKAQDDHTIRMLQQRIKTLEAGASSNTGAVPSLDPLDGLNSFANQSLINVVDKFEKVFTATNIGISPYISFYKGTLHKQCQDL